MSLINRKWYLAFLLVLTGLLSGIGMQAQADPAADWNLKSCSNSNCHGPDPRNPSPISINLNNYTNATLKTKIENSMPRTNAGLGTNPSQCVNQCATDLANFLLPIAGIPPVITTVESRDLVGPGPLAASFSARLSTCSAVPCVLVWDFGGAG